MLINRGPRRPHTGAHGGPTRWPTAAPRGGPRRSPRLINHHMVAIRERLRHNGFRVYVEGFRRGELHLGARRRLGAAATRTVNHKLILLSRRVRAPLGGAPPPLRLWCHWQRCAAKVRRWSCAGREPENVKVN